MSSATPSMSSSPILHPTQHPPAPLVNPHPMFQLPRAPSSAQASLQHPQKIPIPRLRRDSDVASTAGSSRAGEKHRVSHACEPCRHRKTKCSGERPACKHCEDFKINCAYADGKRDRVKKEFGNMAGRLEEYEKLLRQLSMRVSYADQLLINQALEKELSPEADDQQSLTGSIKGMGKPEDLGGEQDVTAEVGSTGSLDRTHEDFNRDHITRATGFLGKNSEITWMHRLQDEEINEHAKGEQEQFHSRKEAPNGHAWQSHTTTPADSPKAEQDRVSDATYHLDDLSIMVPDQVDAYELPPRQIADVLLHTYVDTVHPAFPVLGKLTFTSQFRRFFDNGHLRPGSSWLAILNLVFAIAAKYSHLVQSEWRGDERDHLIYFSRGRMLGLNHAAMFEQPDLQRVQIAALTSFYLMSINQINRSWSFSGLATRYGIMLGLNLRNDGNKLPDTHKEIRYRCWWALCGLDRLLGVMTGRPFSIVDGDCTAPAPLPIDEEQFEKVGNNPQSGASNRLFRRFSSQESGNTVSSPSSNQSVRIKKSPASSNSSTSHLPGFDVYKSGPPTTSLYFYYHHRLGILVNEVLSSLYRASTVSRSWAQVLSDIASLDAQLEVWKSSLHAVFDFTRKQRDQVFTRQRMTLGFSYFSAKIIINRPCLCRVDRRIPNQSDGARVSNRTAATKCVRAAKGMMDLLPEEPNTVGLYKVAPWWCLLHHLMQSTTILMLELSFRADHMPQEAEELLDCTKKAVYWLHQMSGESMAAERAWKNCNTMLRRLAPKIGREVNDLPNVFPFKGDPLVDHASKSPWSSHHQNHPHEMDYTSMPQIPLPRSTGQEYVGGQSVGDSSHPAAVYTSFDQFVSYDPTSSSTSDPLSAVSSLFPTSTQMATMTFGDPALSQVENPSHKVNGDLFPSQVHAWSAQ